MKIKPEWLKYIAFLLCFIVLFLPEENTAWIWVIAVAGIFLLIWITKTFGAKDLFKYLMIIFIILVLISEVGSIEQKWFIRLGIISFIIWLIKIKFQKKD